MNIGLIAGGGDLPHAVLQAAKENGHEIHTAVISGEGDIADFDDGAKEFGIAEFGKITRFFRKYACSHICFAGNVSRPDFQKLRPDFKGLKKLPGAIRAAKQGDDGLLKYIVETFEEEGFDIISPQEICRSLLMPEGHLGAVKLTKEHRDDTEKAFKTASAIGGLDIGQGAVVGRGLVLAVEAQEGTDAMLDRVVGLDEALRGTEMSRVGVLAKMLKPGQEDRVDLPTIGVSTIERAARAGLAGIAVEAGKCFVMDKDKVAEIADEAGMFVVGLPPSKS